MKGFTHKQLDAIDALIEIYPRALWIEPEGRHVFDEFIARGSGLVELIDSDETPSGDAYKLTAQGADAFRAEMQHPDRN